MFNDTGLDTHRFVQKINYAYIIRFKFCLSLYPLLILTRTPFNHVFRRFLLSNVQKKKKKIVQILSKFSHMNFATKIILKLVLIQRRDSWGGEKTICPVYLPLTCPVVRSTQLQCMVSRSIWFLLIQARRSKRDRSSC